MFERCSRIYSYAILTGVTGGSESLRSTSIGRSHVARRQIRYTGLINLQLYVEYILGIRCDDSSRFLKNEPWEMV